MKQLKERAHVSNVSQNYCYSSQDPYIHTYTATTTIQVPNKMTITLAFNSRVMLKAAARASVLDTEKKRNLSKTQHATSTPHDHAPGWNEHLASASEAHVKADRSTASPSELTEKTIKYIHDHHSPENDVQPTEAYYSRDEVDGPLGQAHGSDGEVFEETVEKKKTTTKVFAPTGSEASVKADRHEL
ncbi:hypothetical protein J3R30DRAFT_3703625 [Lentinula aciculospora]|uniref:Uncharacterized protein n=1 Tax=Lentinula aciculospora TaxID=153920 RepID=A0A9W9A9X2_9AGAR|nr:hypothetical protein J3R30DRAFT_3703625 [Lentinula aciculospora]